MGTMLITTMLHITPTTNIKLPSQREILAHRPPAHPLTRLLPNRRPARFRLRRVSPTQTMYPPLVIRCRCLLRIPTQHLSKTERCRRTNSANSRVTMNTSFSNSVNSSSSSNNNSSNRSSSLSWFLKSRSRPLRLPSPALLNRLLKQPSIRLLVRMHTLPPRLPRRLLLRLITTREALPVATPLRSRLTRTSTQVLSNPPHILMDTPI